MKELIEVWTTEEEKILRQFIKYVLSFYSKNGGMYGHEYDWTDEEITAECINRSMHPQWGDGDSVDREAVRDKLIEQTGA